MNKRYLSANEYLSDTWRLAAKVRASGWRPDLLLALWRGGATVGVALHEYFKASGWNGLDHMPVKCASYTGIGESSGEVRFFHAEAVFASLKPGQRVLVVDDVFDSGRTAAALKARIDATGAEMRFACVYWKSPFNKTGFAPDYFTKDVGADWLVFPHEIEGLSREEIGEKDPALLALLDA
jgi:hypothetical protein